MSKNSSVMFSLILLGETRVRTAGDNHEDATIIYPVPSKNRKGAYDLVALGNDVPSKWLKLPPGTKIDLVGRFAKTDTYLCAVTTVATPEVPSSTFGMVLREMSWQKCVAGANEPVAKPEAAAPAEPQSDGGEAISTDAEPPASQSDDAGDPPAAEPEAQSVEASDVGFIEDLLAE